MIIIIFLHAVIGFYIFLSNTKRSIWSIDRTLTSTTIPGQSGPGSNGNEGIHHTPQITKTGSSQLDVVLLSYQHLFGSDRVEIQ